MTVIAGICSDNFYHQNIATIYADTNWANMFISYNIVNSPKENPSFHGYGLQNVHTTLEKYHTLYAMDYENGWFEFATELPNTLIS